MADNFNILDSSTHHIYYNLQSEQLRRLFDKETDKLRENWSQSLNKDIEQARIVNRKCIRMLEILYYRARHTYFRQHPFQPLINKIYNLQRLLAIESGHLEQEQGSSIATTRDKIPPTTNGSPKEGPKP